MSCDDSKKLSNVVPEFVFRPRLTALNSRDKKVIHRIRSISKINVGSGLTALVLAMEIDKCALIGAMRR